MNIVVCVKQIPDPSVAPSYTEEFRLQRDGKLVLDEADTYGVEVALQLVEAAQSGEVHLVSMGDSTDQTGFRTALAMGAVSVSVASDSRLAGADALVTAKVLAALIAGHSPDLVICATESSDGYTGTIAAQLGELLGWPALTFATAVTVVDGQAVIRRQTDQGYDEVSALLPAVISVTAGSVVPRYPTFKGVMAAKSRPVTTFTVDDLDLSHFGRDDVIRERVVSLEPAPVRAAGRKIIDDGEAVEHIVAYLRDIKVL